MYSSSLESSAQKGKHLNYLFVCVFGATRLTFCRNFIHIIPEYALRIEIIISCAYRVVQLAALHVFVKNDGEIPIILTHLEFLIQLIFILIWFYSFDRLR